MSGKQQWLAIMVEQALEYVNEFAVVYGDERAESMGLRWLQAQLSHDGGASYQATEMYLDALVERAA